MADIVHGTQVPIGTRHSVEFMDAALGRVAGIVGAEIVIVAKEGGVVHASLVQAVVTAGAGIPVIARDRVGLRQAARVRTAGIIGADVAVIADERLSADTFPGRTGIAKGTDITVTARHTVGLLDTAQGRVTGIVGAEIIVVAREVGVVHANLVQAVITGGAGVPVTARRGVGLGEAAQLRAAGNIDTDIAVIADEGLAATDTLSNRTGIAKGTDIAVIAWRRVVGVHAALPRQTLVIGASGAVVAIHRHAARTDAIQAGVAQGALVPILTGTAGPGGLERTGPGSWIAGSIQTGCVGAFRLGTENLSARLHPTEMGQFGRVTLKGPIAQVAVFQRSTIVVNLALAASRLPSTDAPRTMITEGASIAVIAIGAIGLEDAASSLVTRIICAGVRVVAFNLGADTDPLLAMVGYGARVAVLALITFQGQIATPGFAIANVLRAVVVIEAQINEIPANLRRFIHVAIAIVIQAVTELCHRGCGIAGGKALLSTDPLARTSARLRGRLAGGPQPQGHGTRRARADPGICHALQCADAINRDRRQT